jgi:hypothetical protein
VVDPTSSYCKDLDLVYAFSMEDYCLVVFVVVADSDQDTLQICLVNSFQNHGHLEEITGVIEIDLTG